MKAVSVGLLAIATSVAAAAAAGSQARADLSADDKALATMLFQQGRALMGDGQISEACTKLEESERLVPAGGTILNLALCHEQDGRLARAWSEFNEALVVAKRDGRHDREIEAAGHVSALEPRLSRLTIVVPAATQVEGLVVERDGHEIGRGAWSTAIPVDGGDHVIRATALGREPFTATVAVGKEFDARTIEIPVLATPVVVVSPLRASAPDGAEPMTASTATRLRLAGLATAGAGVLLLAGGGYALAMALSAKDAANPHCFTDGCDATGIQNRKDAVSRGDLATALGIAGAVLVATGATLYYIGRRSDASRPGRLSARLVLGAAPGAVVTAIAGGF